MPPDDHTERRQPIRAITFDLDDTLWDVWAVIARAEQRLHEWLEVHHPQIPEMFTTLELRQLSAEVIAEQPHIGHDRSRVRKEALSLAACRARCKNFCVDSAYDVFYAARNEVVFFEEVLPALERLARRYTLAALTNGNADIDKVGLGGLFDFAINAVDAGAAKPEPAMFEAACRRLGLAPSQIVHVGDDPQLDVSGAARAGFRTVWVNRSGGAWPGGDRADAEVKTLEELEVLLQDWDRSNWTEP